MRYGRSGHRVEDVCARADSGPGAGALSFLSAHERRRGRTVAPSYALVGADEHGRVELPREVHQALRQVVAALHAGKAVTIAP